MLRSWFFVKHQARLSQWMRYTLRQQILRTQLGLVESERFLTLILREPFDYTQWRQDQWKDTTVAELAEKSRNLRKNNE